MNQHMEELCKRIIDAGALSIRDVDNGEKPFLYSSGNWGCGYISIKGLVSIYPLMVDLCKKLAAKIVRSEISVYFVAGNVTGGMIPAWILSERLGVPFVYVRDTRKKGGHKERITGIYNKKSSFGLVVEELVNFAETTCNSALELRRNKFRCYNAATILTYNNPEAKKLLEKTGMNLIHLITLEELLEVAESTDYFTQNAINGYREFLKNPLKWQKDRGLEPIKEGGTK